jgi:3-hydroxyacyl-CoA dehydrogenase
VASDMRIRAEMRGGVRLLWLDAPPSNLLGPAVRGQLMQALQEAFSAPDVAAVVLIGQGRGFSGGVDLADLGAEDPPTGADLMRLISDAPKPVIAALHGGTYGMAAELALAARGRVALDDLRFGLRDVLAGHLPASGATQTLPRLVGAEAALRMIGQATVMTAPVALAAGIVDQVASGDLATAAVAMALSPPAPERHIGLADGRTYQAAIRAARQAGGGLLGTKLVDCVEAAQLLPLSQGVDFEAEATAEVAGTSEAQALRHAMLAEMRMASDLAGGQAVAHIGFWGAGTLPLIWPALHRGLSVSVADDDREALVTALEKVAFAQEGEVQAGRLDAAARDAEWARLTPGVDPGALAGLGLIVAAKPGASGPVLYLGGQDDAPGVLLVAPAVAELQLRPSDRALGLTAAATLRQMGMRLAITRPAPRAGVVRSLMRAARIALSVLADQGVSGAALTAGIKGWLKLPAPADAIGATDMPAAEVAQYVLAAMAAEGARLLAADAVGRAGDIDALAIAAMGMPRSFGGPMFRADARGLLLLRRDLLLWQVLNPIWTPHPLIDQLLSDGKGFGDLS